MHTRLRSTLTFAFAIFTLVSLGSLGILAQESPSTKVARLLNESTFSVTKIEKDLWTITYEGKAKKEITVGVSIAKDMVLAIAVFAESEKVNLPPQVLMKLLRLNEEYDRVKVGIDREGAVFVRLDLTARTLDKADLITGIDQVAAVADHAYSEIRAHLPKSK